MRKIPAVMATQHPDNALAPYWDPSGDGFINALQETQECVECFAQIGVDEYMWDWEGKHADASVVDKLLSAYHDFFTEKQLAKDIFLTFRIPNIWTEKGYSLIQAMTSILIAEDFSKDLGFKQRPLFEVILPMTESAEQLMKMHKLFESLAGFKSKTFNDGHTNNDRLGLIPLIEGVDSQLKIGELLEKYATMHKEYFKQPPDYLRVFLARSDPAMTSGMLATVLANKIALSQIDDFSIHNSIPVFPIAGVGGLVFRGGLNPKTASDFAKNNPGFKTVTVQSSFRYDHPISEVKKAIKTLEVQLSKSKIQPINKQDEKYLTNFIAKSQGYYQSTLKKIVGDLDGVFASVPRRRERRLHIGLLAYQRSLGGQSLPRAITFTGGFYSVGVPPEFIGLGRSLAALSESERSMVFKYYPALISDVAEAGRYLNKQNLKELAKRNKGWYEIIEDVELTESILGIKLGPKSYSEKAHKNLSANVLLARNNQAILPGLINELAVLRKSLG